MDRQIDALTGLISGAELNAEMEALIEKGDEFALVKLDIDNLMPINQNFGIDAGNAIFRLIAARIGEIFPVPCMGFRGTRDEFDILVPGNKEEAFLGAERLRRAVCEESLGYVSADGTPLKQSVSTGVSSFPDDGSRPADILRRADGAMMRAKKNGRNLVYLAKEEKLTPKTSHYTATQLEKLSLVAENTGAGEAALLREALDDLLKKYDVDR